MGLRRRAGCQGIKTLWSAATKKFTFAPSAALTAYSISQIDQKLANCPLSNSASNGDAFSSMSFDS